MSNPWRHQGVNPQAAGSAASRHRPITVFGDNAHAERAVDRLSNLGFPAVTHDGAQPATTTAA
ncbi:MAG TPA: hypothetical protein VFA63_05825 [Pseudonocardiaceae bacterium]|jgi:hypothetical protein|nr:hypothetical protein [Pseudonocardiaceae bacterium]